MSLKNTIQVFEHQKLTYSKDGPFKLIHWKTLASYAQQTKEEYFTILGQGIKFSNYVGVIQAGNLTIEVLPKTDNYLVQARNVSADENDEEKNTWHKVLIDMLMECKLLQAKHSNRAFLNLRSNTILDLYLQLFLSEVEGLSHEGLIKKYRKTLGNQLALKGRLLFSRNIRENVIHAERFFVDHTVYDKSNIFNRILLKTLKAIRDISNNPFLNDRINRLLFSFPELDDIKIGESTFFKLIFDRKTERYRDAMQLSKMILLNYHPDISGGNENVFAILFDMNRLWEEFVYRRLKREESKYYIKILPQQSENFWKPSHSIYSKTIRPDIVVQFKYKGKEKTIVIDTKWKILKNLIPSDEDLKQMFVYNLFWKCDKSILLYPSSTPASGSGEYHYEVNFSSNNTCAIETITVFDQSKKALEKALGPAILNTLLGAEVLKELRK